MKTSILLYFALCSYFYAQNDTIKIDESNADSLFAPGDIIILKDFNAEESMNKSVESPNPDSVYYLDMNKTRESLLTSKPVEKIKNDLVGVWKYAETTRTNGISTTSRAEKYYYFFNDNSFKIISRFNDTVTGQWTIEHAQLSFYYSEPRNIYKNDPAAKNWSEERKSRVNINSNFQYLHEINEDSLFILSHKMIMSSQDYRRFIYHKYSRE